MGISAARSPEETFSPVNGVALRDRLVRTQESESQLDQITKHSVVKALEASSAVKQKQMRFAPKRNKIINEEVDRLLEVEAIEPFQYPE